MRKVETKPDKRLGTGTQSEDLKLREEGAPTKGRQGAYTPFQSQVLVAILSGSHSLILFFFATSGQQLGLAPTLSPWASITKDDLLPYTG